MHGVVRRYKQKGAAVHEASYKDGKLHGLLREVDNINTTIALYYQGNQQASFTFNKMFEEIDT